MELPWMAYRHWMNISAHTGEWIAIAYNRFWLNSFQHGIVAAQKTWACEPTGICGDSYGGALFNPVETKIEA